MSESDRHADGVAQSSDEMTRLPDEVGGKEIELDHAQETLV